MCLIQSINFVVPLHLKSNLLVVIFPGGILFPGFSVFRIDTNDGDNGKVMCMYDSGGKTHGGPVFFSTLCKQVRNYCFVWAVDFQKLCYSDVDQISEPFTQKISIPHKLMHKRPANLL